MSKTVWGIKFATNNSIYDFHKYEEAETVCGMLYQMGVDPKPKPLQLEMYDSANEMVEGCLKIGKTNAIHTTRTRKEIC